MRTHIYFASDLHLGAPNYEQSRVREGIFVRWLDAIAEKVAVLYLVGDIFDFWFEYGKVVPKGYLRILGKLAELADKGVEIHIFIGNHDLWYQDYFTQEIGAIIHRTPFEVTHFEKKFYIAHGDGLGPGDTGYKVLKSIFLFPLNQWLFARIHPNLGVRIAEFFSRLSGNYTKKDAEAPFYGDAEALLAHSRQIITQNPDIDYFIYGHRHLMKTLPVGEKSCCYYLGDWIKYYSYIEWDGSKIALKQFEKE